MDRTNELHGWLSSTAKKNIIEREYEVDGYTEFGNISRISIANFNNLQRRKKYNDTTRKFVKAKKDGECWFQALAANNKIC